MNLELLLSTQKLVEQAPTGGEIRRRCELSASEPMRIFYGETYDDRGHPIDSMKYYFFLSFLADALQKEGADIAPSVLVADSAACRNVGKKHEEYYMTLGEQRVDFIERVNSIFNTGLSIIRMSDYIHSPQFIEERDRIIEICEANPELLAAVEKTVPESKIEIEREKGFLYSFDEIATIINLDLKIGPPREDLYDEVARNISAKMGQKELMSLFLTPTFPIGMSWAYFFANKGIEHNGITAYKAGSKRLQRNRIIVERSRQDYIRNLIDESFISINPALPNPVLDIGIICEMARKRLEEDDSPITLADDFYEERISGEHLKRVVGDNVETYILSRFR